MRVYRLRQDANHYQSFKPKQPGDWRKMVFDCSPREETWSPPQLTMETGQELGQKLPAGDFYQFSSGFLITSSRATEILRPFLEPAGELFPFQYQGLTYTLLNVTACIDCLDDEKSESSYSRSGYRLGIERYEFHPDRLLSTSVLFKIPESPLHPILIVEGLRKPEEEFKYVVESNGLEGLFFELLWEC